MAVESDTKTVLQSFNSSTLEEVYMKVVCQEPVIETDQDTVTATRSARGSIFLSMAGHWANDTGLEMTTDYFKKSRCKEIRLRWNPMKSIIIKNLLFLLRFRG